jgi:hypothetical protein
VNKLKTRVMARRVPWRDDIEIAMVQSDENGYERSYATITMHQVAPHASIEPMLQLENDVAQQLMDELWLCGLRPTEGSGSAGSLAATERHLADMRSIVAKKLGVLFKS